MSAAVVSPGSGMVHLVENLVVANRLGKSLSLYGILLLGQNDVFDERIGFMAEQNAAELGMRLQSGRQVHFAADDGVVHAVLAAEIADGAIARIDADPQLERLFQPGIAPFGLQAPAFASASRWPC